MTIPLDAVPLAEQRPWLQELEGLGYTDLWSMETSGYDAFGPLALAAGWTASARLGTAIAPVFTRGPALLAMQAAALADAAPGRFVLGIGTAAPLVVSGWNAARFERPVERVRDTLRFLRRALAGERVDDAFETFRVRGFRLDRPPAVAPPIFVAALRERMLRLAGAEADGVVLSLVSAHDVEKMVPIVRAGGRAREVVLRLLVCPTADAERARAIGRRVLAAYLNAPVYTSFHRWLGNADALEPVWRAWRDGDRAQAARALPDSLVDSLIVHGAADECRARIQAYVAAGVTLPIVGLNLPGVDVRRAVRALAPRKRSGVEERVSE